MEVLRGQLHSSKQGRSIVHLEVGEPDFDTPACGRGAQRALRDGRTHYTHSLGHPELREAIASGSTSNTASMLPPERVVSAGSSGRCSLSLRRCWTAVGCTPDQSALCVLSELRLGVRRVPVRVPVRERTDFNGIRVQPQDA